jgi:glycosyltransferase involved in cell wall biosynthesis
MRDGSSSPRYRSAAGATPDVAIISLGTTIGLRYADRVLAELVRETGASCLVCSVGLERLGSLRRGMTLTDAVEAYAARRSATSIRARVFIYSSVTAALLQRPGRPYAVRFDSLAALNRPGLGGLWQRRREVSVLRSAKLLLPWSESGAQAAAALVRACPRSVVLPPPVERRRFRVGRDIDAVAYAANPHKRGLDLLCQAWCEAAPAGSRLLVSGVEPAAARRYLRRVNVAEPDTVEWVGVLPRTRWLDLVSRARLFVNASRDEEWGLAQMEALAAGTPLVTVPSRGLNEALPLARRLAPLLVASDRSPGALGTAMSNGLALDAKARRIYAGDAAGSLFPYRRASLRRTVAEEILPALLSAT